jgi:hypothetical protein
MNQKITQNPVQRLSTNISFFIRVNIVGVSNPFAREKDLKLLNAKFKQLSEEERY